MKTRYGLSAVAAIGLVLFLTLATCGGAQAQTFAVIHNFNGQGDGGTPLATPLLDASGNLYGTTNYGTVYKLSPAGSSWVLATIYRFHGRPDGDSPWSQMVEDPRGLVYGATSGGGFFQNGTVFQLTPSPTLPGSTTAPWAMRQLHDFGYPGDGAVPFGGLAMDREGSIFGTTSGGGSYGDGTVFKLTPSNGGWRYEVFHSFSGMDGSGSYAGVVFDAAGNLYGTTPGGGSTGCGVVYQMTPSGAETVLYNFTNGMDGCNPSGVILDGSGNLYGGTTEAFELSQSNGAWSYTPICALPSGVTGFVNDTSGNLYGTAVFGGPSRNGSVFKLTRASGDWTYTTLYEFSGGADGCYPYAGLVRDSDGNLYGAASGCGTYGAGVIFEITP